MSYCSMSYARVVGPGRGIVKFKDRHDRDAAYSEVCFAHQLPHAAAAGRGGGGVGGGGGGGAIQAWALVGC